MTEPENAYDAVPYVAHVIDGCNLSYLHAVARLFGIRPTDYRRARVLELGCAGGLNLVALAEQNPGARLSGIDLSAGQIDEAAALAAASGVTNATFRQGDIMEMPVEPESYDIILCHGVLSWVGPAVQERIFEILGGCLAPGGIALLSYNTLPGWHMVRAVRDMMRFHCARFADPATKVAEAIALLEAVQAATPDGQAGYREAVAAELALLRSRDAGYILHDHLEEENHQFYIGDIIERSERAGLRYLADVQLPTMVAGAASEPIARLLAGAETPVQREQYLDFLRNRRFRNTLLCRGDAPPLREPDPQVLLDMHVASRLTVAEAPDRKKPDRPFSFRGMSGGTLVSRNPALTALCLGLVEAGPRPAAVAAIIAAAAARSGAPAATIRQLFLELGMKLVFDGALVPLSWGSPELASVPARPKGSACARALCGRSGTLPNRRHQNVPLGAAERAILSLCDGTRDPAAIAAALAERPGSPAGAARSDRVIAALRTLCDAGFLVS
jgi:SAM-dependent methyltransferase